MAVLNFQPKDEKSKSDIFFESIKDYPVGRLFSYDQLRSLTGFDVKGVDRGVIYDANRKLLTECNKMLKNVRKTGYKIATPQEQLSAGVFRRTRARRQVDKGTVELSNLDVSRLSQEERTRQLMMINHFAAMAQISRKRSLVSLEKTQVAKRNIIEAESEQKAAIREIDEMERQLRSLRKKFGD